MCTYSIAYKQNCNLFHLPVGVWIALLRVMDGLSYQFAENLDEFPYFGPRALSVEHFGEQPSI